MEHEPKPQAVEMPARIRARAARYRHYATILSGHDDAQRDVLGLADELDALADRVEHCAPVTMGDVSPD